MQGPDTKWSHQQGEPRFYRQKGTSIPRPTGSFEPPGFKGPWEPRSHRHRGARSSQVYRRRGARSSQAPCCPPHIDPIIVLMTRGSHHQDIRVPMPDRFRRGGMTLEPWNPAVEAPSDGVGPSDPGPLGSPQYLVSRCSSRPGSEVPRRISGLGAIDTKESRRRWDEAHGWQRFRGTKQPMLMMDLGPMRPGCPYRLHDHDAEGPRGQCARRAKAGDPPRL